MATKDLSLFINRMVPAYVLEEYAAAPGDPSFELFLSYFFQFLGQKDVNPDGTLTLNPMNVIQNLIEYRDIDETETQFLSFFKNKYAIQYPYIGKYDVREGTTSMNIRTMIKKIREFYVSKGTMDSVKFFFRSVFDKEIEIYYPKADMLRFSDGKWFTPYYLGMIRLDGSPLSLLDIQGLPDHYVHAQTSGAKGYIEAIPLETSPNATKNMNPFVWASITSKDGNFVDGETVDIIDSVTNEITATFKLRTRGYEDLDGTFPPQPYNYLGAWKNNKEYKERDVIYDPPTNTFYIALAEHTSITYPSWVIGTRYKIGSIVVYNGKGYQVPDARPTYKNALTPDMDSRSWTFLSVVSADNTSPTWNAANVYSNNDVVKHNIGGIWKIYRLNQFRSAFVNAANPEIDTHNWDEIYAADPGWPEFVGAAWDPTEVYYAPDRVVKDGVVFLTRFVITDYRNNIEPALDSNWIFVGDVDVNDVAPIWSELVFYDAFDVAKVRVGMTSVYKKYRMRYILPSEFLSTVQPILEPSRWVQQVGTPNFTFAQEVAQSTKWKALPAGVDPERIGASSTFPGRWLNTDGFLSSDKKIQDSFFYQDYSYQIKVDLDRTVFFRPLVDNVHPAGFQLFNIVENVETLVPYDVGVTLSDGIRFNIEWPRLGPLDLLLPAIGQEFNTVVAPYVTFNTTAQLDYTGFELTADDYRLDQFQDNVIGDWELKAGSNHVWVFNDGVKLPSVPHELLRLP